LGNDTTQRTFASANMLRTCYGEVANFLWTHYEETMALYKCIIIFFLILLLLLLLLTGVMDFGL